MTFVAVLTHIHSWRRTILAILGVPLGIVVFVILSALAFVPIGGGIDHLLFAYSNGHDNLSGLRVVGITLGVIQLLVLSLFRWMRYPGPWYLHATTVVMGGELVWVPILRTHSVSESFHAYTLLGAVMLALVPFVIARIMTGAATSSEDAEKARTRGADTHVSSTLVDAIRWAVASALMATLLLNMITATAELFSDSDRSLEMRLSQWPFSFFWRKHDDAWGHVHGMSPIHRDFLGVAWARRTVSGTRSNATTAGWCGICVGDATGHWCHDTHARWCRSAHARSDVGEFRCTTTRGELGSGLDSTNVEEKNFSDAQLRGDLR